MSHGITSLGGSPGSNTRYLSHQKNSVINNAAASNSTDVMVRNITLRIRLFLYVFGTYLDMLDPAPVLQCFYHLDTAVVPISTFKFGV